MMSPHSPPRVPRKETPARRGRFELPLFVVCLCLVPAGCRSRDQAGSPEGPSSRPDAAEARSKEPDKPRVGVVHSVAPGQTLWDIARAYNTTVKSIMDANDMRPRDVRRLSKGRKLFIPNATQQVPVETAADRASKRKELQPLDDGAYHFLRRGESVWTLARLYDVSIEDIIARNGFSDGELGMLRMGQPVIIPGIKSSQIKQKEPSTGPGILHQMAKGETIWDLAYAFGVSVAEIMTANSLSREDATSLMEGMELLIPGVEEDRSGRIRRRPSARERRAAILARRLGLGTRQVAGQLLRGVVERRWLRAAGGSKRLPGTLRWPVTNGWFTRGYGSGEDGYHLAVDIMGEIGWNVRAAARGVVAYSGNGVRGYGNMVLVVHPGGWATMYAHNSVNFVSAGEKVPRGAILAELGSTGISRGPHVHFEFIYGGKNCDPAPLFRPGVRHRNGKLSRIAKGLWRVPAKRPADVRCGPRRRHPRSRWVIHEDPLPETEHK